MDSFIFKSTGILMGLLEKIFGSKIKVQGIEKIPDTPVLFVANHFTRSETFILPYILHKLTRRKVRSLADKSIFVGTLGAYLKRIGTLSVSDPNRDNLIIGDLLTGRSDWLIYPEGEMLKNRHIIFKKHYILHTSKSPRRIPTGSAVLALKTELVKKEFLVAESEKDKDKIKEICKNYFLSGRENINPKPLNIVPITINFYPIRPGANKIHSLISKFVRNIPDRISEEIEIEGNLLTGSEVLIQFSDPIDVYEYIKKERRFTHKIPLLPTVTKNSLVINYFRHRLTHEFMSKLYEASQINFDHIFASSLYFWNSPTINRTTLKNLIYNNAKDIKKLGKYFLHESIDKKLAYLFFDKENKYYDSVFNLAIKQDIIRKDGEIYHINHTKLNNPQNFHQDRLFNTLRIFVNSMLKYPEIIKIFKQNARLPKIMLNNKTFNTLLKSDEKEYIEDYEKYFSEKDSKHRSLGMPFYLPAKRSTKGIIISHGYKSCPEEIRNLAEYLGKEGYHIYAVRLKGHGTAPKNINDVSWEEWYDSFFKGYAALKQRCDSIISMGFSTGGLLALLLASRKQEKISAVISINAALKLRDIRVNFVPTIHYWNEFLNVFKAKKGKKEFIIDAPENPDINYSKNYLRGVKELSELMDEVGKNLKNITAPALIIQGSKDPVIDPKSGDIIYKKIASETKELYTPDYKNHVIVRKFDQKLYSHIAEFIKGHLDSNEKN